jgi:hypothetical protein
VWLWDMRRRACHSMPRLSGGELVCGECGEEFVFVAPGRAFHPGTAALRFWLLENGRLLTGG